MVVSADLETSSYRRPDHWKCGGGIPKKKKSESRFLIPEEKHWGLNNIQTLSLSKKLIFPPLRLNPNLITGFGLCYGSMPNFFFKRLAEKML